MPERDAVREAVVLMLSATPYRLLDPLADALGHKGTFPERIADALLSHAQPEGEVVAWAVWIGDESRILYHTFPSESGADDFLRRMRLEREVLGKSPWSESRVVPLYTRPAPVVTEAMVEAHAKLMLELGIVAGDGTVMPVMRAAMSLSHTLLTAALAAARGNTP